MTLRQAQGGRGQPDLIRRQQATSTTLAQFRGREAAWGTKWGNCAAMLHFHLSAMGHDAGPFPVLRSLRAAQAELARRGAANLAEVVAAQGLEEIASAMMLPGDVAYRSSLDGLGGVLVCVGHGAFMGWFENEETAGKFSVATCDLGEIEKAWRA